MGTRVITTVSSTRALFERLPRLADLVPFLPLADGLPTPVEQVEDDLWVQRDDHTASAYGGNKVRKLEFLLPVAQRRGGPLITAGGIGSHHVLAAATYATQLGLPVEAVLYPQPETDDVLATSKAMRELGIDITTIDSPYTMPLALARRLATHARSKPYLLWPGASTALGTLGYVSAGLELVDSFAANSEPEPDVVVVAFGSGGSAVGLAIGLTLGGWTAARVLAVRVTDRTVANPAVAAALEVSTDAILVMGGWRPRPARIDIVGSWIGAGYGRPTTAGKEASRIGASFGLALEPTYTEKAFAAALAEYRRGRRVVFVQTYAGRRSAP